MAHGSGEGGDLGRLQPGLLNSVHPLHEIFATDIAADAFIEGPGLVTRLHGKRFLEKLALVLGAAGDVPVVVDFAGIELMDASFADEVFVTMAADRARRARTGPCLLLRNLSDTCRENLEYALVSRPHREPGLRNCVLPVVDVHDRVELLGKYEDHVRQTFDLLRRKRQITARELAESAGYEISAASTRLKVLYNLGLACRHEARDERGRLFVYSSIS